MTTPRDEVLNTLNSQQNAENYGTNDAHDERHKQNSHTESIPEFEPRSRNEPDAKASREQDRTNEALKVFPLIIVLRACPEISCPNGVISNWRDLMAAAVTVRSMLGVSPSAYQEACEAMGSENAAVTIACILERAGHINSAGGYLRDLTSKTKRGVFSLGPVLMALLRAHGQGEKRTG
ncbi:hypothetical protein EBB04_33195 [Sinorhizobium meliloti]|nr:hypothetical protein EBB04_33195 [Sinorhizobium meliloti]